MGYMEHSYLKQLQQSIEVWKLKCDGDKLDLSDCIIVTKEILFKILKKHYTKLGAYDKLSISLIDRILELEADAVERSGTLQRDNLSFEKYINEVLNIEVPFKPLYQLTDNKLIYADYNVWVVHQYNKIDVARNILGGVGKATSSKATSSKATNAF
jgi:hypothetical protein